jgi:hypothetical protein
MGKYAPFFLLPPRETEEAAIGCRRRPGTRGKGEGRCAGVIPVLTSGWGGAQRRVDGSGRRRVEETAAAALRARKGSYGRRAGLWGG